MNNATKTFRIRTSPRRALDGEFVLLVTLASVLAPLVAIAVKVVCS